LLYESLVKQEYERGKAIKAASTMEFDEVIDPSDTRKWINLALNTYAKLSESESKNRYIDCW